MSSSSDIVNMPHTRTVKMLYHGKLTEISLPSFAKYDDFIKVAMVRFSIPVHFKDFIRILAARKYTFDKKTFEKYLLIFPKPEMVFEIRVNYAAVLDNLHLDKNPRKILKKPIFNYKRKNTEKYEELPKKKMNWFSRVLKKRAPEARRTTVDVIRGTSFLDTSVLSNI